VGSKEAGGVDAVPHPGVLWTGVAPVWSGGSYEIRFAIGRITASIAILSTMDGAIQRSSIPLLPGPIRIPRRLRRAASRMTYAYRSAFIIFSVYIPRPERPFPSRPCRGSARETRRPPGRGKSP
jgi:hypothetical protein